MKIDTDRKYVLRDDKGSTVAIIEVAESGKVGLSDFVGSLRVEHLDDFATFVEYVVNIEKARREVSEVKPS